MAFQLQTVLTVLWLGLVAIQAATPSDLYWKSVLPDTPMPKAIEDILSPDVLEEESTSVGVGKGGVRVNAPGKGGRTKVGVSKGGGVGVRTGSPGKGTTVGVGKGGVGVRTGKGGRTKVGVGKGGVSVRTPGKKGGVVVGVKPGEDPFNYKYAATETQLQDDRQTAVFFLEKDLKPNTEMSLIFTKSSKEAAFLPRQVADLIPFSSAKMPEILNQLSVGPDSEEAEQMKTTITDCEEPAVKGEQKLCATSLESMIDFATSKLGKNVLAVSTEVEKETQIQKYTIKGVKKISNGKAVACHKQNYPYAVFYCHATSTTRAYVVPLVGANGTKAKATAVCHTDTSSWNPKHLAFQVLNVKPGTVPVCHFLPEDHVVWAST